MSAKSVNLKRALQTSVLGSLWYSHIQFKYHNKVRLKLPDSQASFVEVRDQMWLKFEQREGLHLLHFLSPLLLQVLL